MILVTGASGFLGRHLVRQLSMQDKPVRALYCQTLPDDELRALPHITWQSCDLLDVFDVAEVFEGITEVYHCAAMVSFDPAQKAALLHFNIESTINVVNAALEAGIRKMVYISSVASLGRNEGDTLNINEEAEWEESSRNSAYGASKYFAEMEVWRGIGEGLDAVILNPGIILGAPYPFSPQWRHAWDAGSAHLMKIVAGEFPFYTEGINAWVDVADVARIMQEVMQAPISAERFIVSNGNFAYKDIFTQMANALGKRPPHIKASSWMTNLVWRYASMKSRLTGTAPLITRETARNAQTCCLYDNSKLLSLLPGFQYTPMAETIRSMAAIYQAQTEAIALPADEVCTA